MNVVIACTGGVLGSRIVPNGDFSQHTFYEKNGERDPKPIDRILEKFAQRSGILERRYALADECTTDLAAASLLGTGDSLKGLDYLIVAHNFGDTMHLGQPEVNWLPSGASVAKHRLGINDPRIVAIDVLCDGETWDSVSDALSKTGLARRLYAGDCNELSSPAELGDSLPDYMVHRAALDRGTSVAERVKRKLGIDAKVPAFDVIAGCAGGLESTIIGYELIKNRQARKVAIASAEVLSRLCDPHDKDSLLYADGGGAFILERVEGEGDFGILGYAHKTYSDKSGLLTLGPSLRRDFGESIFLKMDGPGVKTHAVSTVPDTIREGLQRAGVGLDQVSVVAAHQANKYLNDELMAGLGLSPGQSALLMPLILCRTGNFSGGSVLHVVNRLYRGELENHRIGAGEYLNLVSVGAGMTEASIVHREPPAALFKALRPYNNP